MNRPTHQILMEHEHAKETLDAIRDGCFNLKRPKRAIIHDLMLVIRLLDERLQSIEA